jgi:hypothetical protein
MGDGRGLPARGAAAHCLGLGGRSLVQPGPAPDPATIAAGLIQKALARVLDRPCFRRITCLSPRGHPGAVLLTQASQGGLLVLGMTGIGAAPAPGRVNWYCLGRGHCPLIFVPAASGPSSPFDFVPPVRNQADTG